MPAEGECAGGPAVATLIRRDKDKTMGVPELSAMVPVALVEVDRRQVMLFTTPV
jgi:hypothetical protein